MRAYLCEVDRQNLAVAWCRMKLVDIDRGGIPKCMGVRTDEQ
jgi:hypothetical protein